MTQTKAHIIFIARMIFYQCIFFLSVLCFTSVTAAPIESPSKALVKSSTDRLNFYKNKKFTILILGDSLTEGYGVDRAQAYPALVEAEFKQLNFLKLRVINGGVSGATTASGVNRLKWYLRARPDIMVLALGANDGLRGIKVIETKNNLRKTIQYALQKKIKVILAGMKVPPNYGKKRGLAFDKMFADIAKKYSLTTIPFLLDGVAGEKLLNLPDGIHPNPKGHKKIALTVQHAILNYMQTTKISEK